MTDAEGRNTQRGIEQFLDSEGRKDLLRFITCGSVDDGKSTLIGRLLYEAQQIHDDQLTSLMNDSQRVGTRGSEIDFALLVDGLAAEREQGITIDVAYRYFATARRKYIVADTPGHEQYTRNMVTGASTADVAVLLVDARKGILTQTRRHAYIVSLLGIRHVVVVVNKMDLVGYDAGVFDRIVADFDAFAGSLGFSTVRGIPACAVDGDNIVSPSASMSWYAGPPLLRYLDELPLEADTARAGFLMPVQWVSRPSADFRGFAGRIVSGAARPGLGVRVLPSGQETAIARLVAPGGDLGEVAAGRSVMLTLASEVDISRGDVLCGLDAPVDCASKFDATVVWMHEEPLLQGREYLFKLAARTALATVAPLKFRINVNTLERLPAERLELNDIGVCELSIDQPVPFRPYAEDREMGGFILIDRLTNHTVGAGMLNFALRRSENVHWQALDVDRAVRSAQKGQRGCVVWMTGLSGAGKSTIANILEKKLVALGRHTYLLDGDNVRHGLNKDLGFTQQDRVENVRRVAEVAALMADAGLITIVSFISPFRAERRVARELLPPGDFLEIHIDTPLAVAEARDVKGLYRKARSGKLANFTGIDSPYEVPEAPEVRIDTTSMSADAAADQILSALNQRGLTRVGVS
jgi:bifunctional enzyme CysN/CysC